METSDKNYDIFKIAEKYSAGYKPSLSVGFSDDMSETKKKILLANCLKLYSFCKSDECEIERITVKRRGYHIDSSGVECERSYCENIIEIVENGKKAVTSKYGNEMWQILNQLYLENKKMETISEEHGIELKKLKKLVKDAISLAVEESL